MSLITAVTLSWYGAEFDGSPMANGKPFDPEAMTCASNKYPLGSLLVICRGNKCVAVWVTDRMSQDIPDDHIDLSKAAFKKLAPLSQGRLIGVAVDVTSALPSGRSKTPSCSAPYKPQE